MASEDITLSEVTVKREAEDDRSMPKILITLCHRLGTAIDVERLTAQ